MTAKSKKQKQKQKRFKVRESRSAMAVAVVKFKNGKKGMGTPHFDYIVREGKYALKADDLERLVIADSGNMPEWAMNDPKLIGLTAKCG